MKKVLFPILVVVLALALAIPMAGVVGASPATMTVVSDTSVLITGVYNKAGGGNSVVDLSGSPLNAVRAWEPDPYADTYPTEPPEATDSTWDNALGPWNFEDNASTADWIWETHRAEDPASYDIANLLYDADAARYGRVVLFKKTFNIPGTPTSATLHIAADNAYEFWVNGGSPTRSATAAGGAGWENSNLKQANVLTSGWQTVGAYNILSDLTPGSNTLYVLAGNEYFWGDDPPNFNNPTQSNPYRQYNPGALIFQVDIEYEEPLIEVDKDYRYTEVCFEKDNDGDGEFNEDPVEEEIDNDGDGLFDEDPIDGIDNDGDGAIDEDPSEQIDNDGDSLFGEDDIDCPLGTDLGTPLPTDVDGNYTLEAVIHPKNDKVKSYNPGQYYAVSTVNVPVDIDTLTIVEDWSACSGISVLNPPNGGGSVVIVQVGPDGVARQILDAHSPGVTVDPAAGMATAVLEDVPAGTTIYMYVKFGPGLKGQTWAGPYDPCINYNRASIVEVPTLPEDWIEASAWLILIEKE